MHSRVPKAAFLPLKSEDMIYNVVSLISAIRYLGLFLVLVFILFVVQYFVIDYRLLYFQFLFPLVSRITAATNAPTQLNVLVGRVSKFLLNIRARLFSDTFAVSL